MNVAQIVFINIADYPHLIEVGDGEEVGSVVEALDAFGSGDILLDDRAGDGSAKFDQRAGMGRVAAQQANMMLGILDIHTGFLFRVFRLLQVFFRQCAVGEEQLRPVEALLRQALIGGRLLIVGKRSRQIGALNGEQHLTFLHRNLPGAPSTRPHGRSLGKSRGWCCSHRE